MVSAQDYYELGKKETNPLKRVEYFTKALKQRTDKWVYYQRAFAYIDLKKYNSAIKDFTSALQANGNLDDSYIYSGLASVYYYLGNDEKCLEISKKAAQLNPNNKWSAYYPAWVSVSNKKYAEALNYIDKFVKIDEQEAVKYNTTLSSSGFADRSYINYLLGNYDKALVDINRAIELAPKFEAYKKRKAMVLIKLGKKEEAYGELKKMGSFDEDNPISIASIGDIYKNNSDFETAIAYYKDAVNIYYKKAKEDADFKRNLKKDIYDVFLSTGFCYERLLQYQDALDYYNRAKNLDKTRFFAWFDIGNLQTHQGNYKEAIYAFEQAYKIRPDYAGGWVNYGFSYSELGKEKEAIDVYSKGIKAMPKEALLYNNRGFGYLTLKQYDKAFSDLQKAISLDPEVVMSHVSIAEYYVEIKNADEAIKKAKESLAMKNGNAREYTAAYIALGNAYMLKKNYEAAIAQFKNAINETPSHPNAHERLGIAYYFNNQLCLANKTLKKALKLDSYTKIKTAKESAKYLGLVTAKDNTPCD